MRELTAGSRTQNQLCRSGLRILRFRNFVGRNQLNGDRKLGGILAMTNA